jgi:hypothetical protein
MESSVPQEQFSLFEKLPGELRNRVYRYVVIYSGHTVILASYSKEDGVLTSIQPALSTVNKQIRKEVLSIYCAENTFLMPVLPHEVDEESRAARRSASYRRGLAWAQSCGPFVSLITKVGAFHMIGCEFRAIIASISKDTSENLIKLHYQNGNENRLHARVCSDDGQFSAGRLVASAMDTCRYEIWKNLFSPGSRCPVCGLQYSTRFQKPRGVETG